MNLKFMASGLVTQMTTVRNINLDDYDFEDILNSIYEDEIFVLIPSDYGLYYYN